MQIPDGGLDLLKQHPTTKLAFSGGGKVIKKSALLILFYRLFLTIILLPFCFVAGLVYCILHTLSLVINTLLFIGKSVFKRPVSLRSNSWFTVKLMFSLLRGNLKENKSNRAG